ncbi:MAG TPA: CHAD domain-containing protein [Myxococcota bacterium]|nr:CHAD domain-containing protein [Myxococcota bacterium]HRY94971.1 CHAD domain-containing protein [Myxococcota bacterium]HSA19966.1 CHAD domain-containing protein [Myxococcota bacterium]
MEPTTPAPTADAGHALLCAETLLAHLEAVRLEIPGVRLSEDPECVHRMRVGSRRLRTALGLFEDLLGKPARSWRRATRAVTRALGEARDLDVQLALVEELRAAHRADRARAGLERLALRLRQARGRAQADVREALDGLEASHLLDEVAHSLQQLRVRAELQGAGARAPGAYTLLRARQASGVLVEDLLAYDPFVRDPTAIEPLHRMRIAAKRLRYTLEVFVPALPGALEPYVAAVKKVQTLLGELHDCDVWLAYVPGLREAERQRTLEFLGHTRSFGALLPGLELVENDRRARREATYARFVALWDGHREARLWPELLGLLGQRAEGGAAS